MQGVERAGKLHVRLHHLQEQMMMTEAVVWTLIKKTHQTIDYLESLERKPKQRSPYSAVAAEDDEDKDDGDDCDLSSSMGSWVCKEALACSGHGAPHSGFCSD